MADRTDPRSLALAFFRGLRDAGEEELRLSDEAIRVVREGPASGSVHATPEARRPTADGPPRGNAPAAATAAGREEVRPGAPRAPGGAAPDPGDERRRRAQALDAAAAADTIPEPEVVEATIAFAADRRAPDMFSETGALDAATALDDIRALAEQCERCELARGRTNVVFGAGNPNAKLMFVGEAPGRDEDLSGVPFVGRAGQLLNKILEAAGIERDDVYIANIIKCRPPGNRTPLTNEIEACLPFLARQYEFIKPRIICTLGLPATQTLLKTRGAMGALRGKIYRSGGIRVIPTYHPAAALRDPKYKRPIWEDFLVIRREYERD